MGKSIVSLLKFNDKKENIKKAIEMCDGLKDINPNDKILIKPNMVNWDTRFPFPKYGSLTTALIMEEIVKLLSEAGCNNIAIGDGIIEDKDFGSYITNTFTGMGLYKLRDRYGVKLLDFNEGPFTEVNYDNYSLNIYSYALEADFIVDLPVLKTHNSTGVSLGFKNLKGCLNRKSKIFCHNETIALDDFIYRYAEDLYPGLTIIDGIYALERGPFWNGRAYRSDLIIASRNMFAADFVGTSVLGLNPADIGHLRMYAEDKGLPLDGSNIEVLGEDIDSVKMNLAYDWEYLEDNSGPIAFKRAGVSGIYYPKYDNTICSNCTFKNNLLLILIMGAFDGTPFDNIEFLSGKIARSEGGFNKTFLYGNCSIQANKNNPNIKEAVKMPGCAPTIKTMVSILNEHGINAKMEDYEIYRQRVAQRYENRPEFNESHFTIT